MRCASFEAATLSLEILDDIAYNGLTPEASAVKIKIIKKHSENGLQFYSWSLWTGPDGIDEYSGIAHTLGACFEDILKKELYNAFTYRCQPDET